ncbi:MAG: hypothetical protein IJU28_04270 [Clostridia bacterium]|nr:hypothetical protein [Clostridia bacterium]
MAASIRGDPSNRLIRAQGATAKPARAEPTTARPAKVETAAVTLVEGKNYKGAYTVTPNAETQVLSTNGLKMTDDVIINPIPSNYGLITYNGAVITVS